MAIRVQASFAAGELDPAIQERTTLQKYDSGLSVGRNVIVGKTGRIMSRSSRRLFIKAKLSNRKVIVYCPPQTGYIIEFGHLYCRVYAKDVAGISSSYGPSGQLIDEFVHDIPETSLDYVRFETSAGYVYVFCGGFQVKKLFYGPGGGFMPSATIFGIPTAPTAAPTQTIAGTGYDVDYAFTTVRGGEESTAFIVANGKLPIAVAESNLFTVTLGSSSGKTITEMRVYRRPRGAGAFGYIGSSSALSTTSGVTSATYRDTGSAADYAHAPPTLDVGVVGRGSLTDPLLLLSPAGAIYQQRLLITDVSNQENIYASRPGLANNFTREYPLSSDSQLLFKAGASGYARVLHMINNDGLTVFTSAGVFLHSGALSPTNLALEKKGNWIADENVPPIPVPGGIIFIDSSTNTVRVLAWSNEAASYSGEEVSVFSDHLFVNKKIVSWAFHSGATPLLWVVFSDGTYASFTYERDQLMRAWTRHDTLGCVPASAADPNIGVEFVAASGVPDRTYFVVRKGLDRYIEVTTDRYYTTANPRQVPDYLRKSDAQWMMKNNSVLMDSMSAYNGCINQQINSADPITVTPVVAGNWAGQLTLSSATAYFPVAVAPVGAILRFFAKDYSSIDLLVLSRTSDNSITVLTSATFPSKEASNPMIYTTTANMTGLDHLEGEYVSILSDGYVLASPNNDFDILPLVQVVGGSVTLPGGLRGSIIHVGRPVTADAATLDIATVEQRPVLIESLTVNKVYVKVHKTRGLFAGPRFSPDNKVAAKDQYPGMEDLDRIQVDYSIMEEVLGNTFQMPVTKRIEYTMPGDWKSQGKVCFRQVDPLHFEILSVMPDLEDERR